MRKLLKNKHIANSGLLVFALMFANGMNFLFNAYLGRVLSFEHFGLITLITSLWYLISIPIGSVGGTLTHTLAYLNGRSLPKEATSFFVDIKNRTLKVIAISALIWLIISPFVASFFQTSSVFAVASLSLVILFGSLLFFNRAYLQANFFFSLVAIAIILESVIKFLSALVFSIFGAGHLAYLSIPISLIVAFIFTFLYVAPKLKGPIVKNSHAFPRKFYIINLVSGLSSTAFLTLDVILVKHYFDPETAGQYALLSLIGKMVYFLGSLLNSIIFTYASNEAGKSVRNRKLFYKLLSISLLLTISAYIMLGIFGYLFIPILFGVKSLSILPYLPIYTLAMALVTLGSIFVTYHTVYKEYIFAYISIFMALAMCIGIFLFHANILQVSYAILVVSILSFTTIIAWHLKTKDKVHEPPNT